MKSIKYSTLLIPVLKLNPRDITIHIIRFSDKGDYSPCNRVHSKVCFPTGKMFSLAVEYLKNRKNMKVFSYPNNQTEFYIGMHICT